MLKALVIDNEPSEAVALAGLLEAELRLAPVVACNAETALEILTNFEYVLVISHPLVERKGEADRWQWLDCLQRRLRISQSGVPRLVMTTHTPDFYCNYTDHGLQGLLVKPFDWSQALKEIWRVVNF